MHMPTRFLILPSLMAVIYAQNSTPPVPVQVRSLTIISASLPEEDRQRIVHALRGGTYVPEELAERVRQYLRDAGYYNARVEALQLSALKKSQDGRSADFTTEVNPGPLYALGGITFEGAKVFTSDQLRSQFSSKTGEHFNATEIGKGLENLRKLYGSKGYANFVAIPKPQIDEARHIIGLVIDVDEGRPIRFGVLRLEGIEPVAGAGKSLLASWKDIQGKQYNPEVLNTWLESETSDWPHEAAAQLHTEYVAGSTPNVAIDVLLHFQ
jgi:outer membrane translocation and assembly module TamA